jgi:hypothetical protein
VIFQALETSSASLTSAASAISLAPTASKYQFPQKIPDPDDLIITGTKRTNTGHFFVGWIINNPIFHKYMAPFLTEAVEAKRGQKSFK